MKIKYFILASIVVFFSNCSKESISATTADDMNGVASHEHQVSANAPMDQGPVKVIGYFTNVQSNGEHQWGHTVQIWWQGSSIYGLLSGSSSPMTVGDPPTGILEDQIFDERSGKFSFNTKTLSNRYGFDGILSKSVLRGRLLNTLTNEIENIVLKRDKESSLEMMDDFASYEDWKVYADKILKFRGPKS